MRRHDKTTPILYNHRQMDESGRFAGALTFLKANASTLVLRYGSGLLLLLMVIAYGAANQRWLWVIEAAALLALLIYFFLASLWSAYALYDAPGRRDSDHFWQMGQLQPTDTIVVVDLGLRWTAVALARRLTSGRVIVIDVYNPQLTPGRPLARLRAQAIRPITDPRLTWRESSINLLPLPDSSVTVVTLSRVTSQLWQEGDRLLLLKEIYRLLAPGGRLLMSERVRSRANVLIMGLGGLRLPTAAYWRNLLQRAGFQVQEERDLQGLVRCFRAGRNGQ
ncbi:MAG: class I SAM-dependent methyltransferase [Chloroflexota bacterium]